MLRKTAPAMAHFKTSFPFDPLRVPRSRRFSVLRRALLLLLPMLLFLTAGAALASDAPVVTHLGPVAADLIGITVRAGTLEHGAQSAYVKEEGDLLVPDGNGYVVVIRNGASIGRLTGKDNSLFIAWDALKGQKLDTSLADRPGSYALRSTNDSSYLKPVIPSAVYRKTRPTDLGWVGTSFEAPLEHVLYLKLPRTLKTGKRYTVTFAQGNLSPVTFTYNPASMRSEAVHVSHIGFRPDDPSKVAFLSLWMGSGGGKAFAENTRFYVLNDSTGAKVFQGYLKLSKLAADTDEDAYGRNFNGTNVYIMDFSAFAKTGKFRVYVEGVGCSYPFDISGDVWKKAFYVSVRGLYHQRSGIELLPPYTTFYRPRMFHPDDGVKVYASKAPLMATDNGLTADDRFALLLGGLTTEIVPDAWGGYSDAGDWDRRIQHLDVARHLFNLAESFPGYFEAFDLTLPESHNGFPDIVNEALWSIDFFRRLQTAEGGVRGGIESAAHPRYGEASWQESQTVMAYEPDVWTTYLYAGAAARAAYWLLPRNATMSRDYWLSAIKAILWAEWKYSENSPDSYPYQVRDARNLAAAEYFRLSGDPEFHDVFLQSTAFTNPSARLTEYMDHDQGEAAWIYYNTNRAGMDESVRTNCKNAIIAEAESRIAAQAKAGFKWTKDLWRPAFAGTFTVPDCVPVARAHAITGKPEYLKSIVLAAQTGAGANPLNMSYTTGVGYTYPANVMHTDARVSGQTPPPGLTVLGPIDVDHFGGAANPDHMLPGQFCYPEAKQWPVIENYWDVYWYPMTNEYTVQNTIGPNAYVWGYLAAR